MASHEINRVNVASAFWRGLDAVGIHSNDVLRRAGLSGTPEATGGASLSVEQYLSIWQAVEDLANDSAIGVTLALCVDPAWLPPGFLAAMYADDFREALLRSRVSNRSALLKLSRLRNRMDSPL